MRKTYWLLIILGAVLLPFGLNWLILQPSRFEVIGDGTHWLSFWGGYLGALISSAVAFYILQDNRKDNKANRKLQMNLVLYQQEKDRLRSLRRTCTEYSNLFSTNDFIAMVAELKCDRNKVALSIKQLLNDIGSKYSDLIIYIRVVSEDRTPEEVQFIDALNQYKYEFTELVIDMQEINQYFEGAVNSQGSLGDFISNNSRVSQTIKDYIKDKSEDYGDQYSYITRYILRYYKCSANFQLGMMNYFKYEEDRINQLLTKDI